MPLPQFLARLGDLLRSKFVPADDGGNAVASSETSRPWLRDWVESFAPAPGRTAAYYDYDAMDLENPAISSALDAIADAAVSGSDGSADWVFRAVFPDRTAEGVPPDMAGLPPEAGGFPPKPALPDAETGSPPPFGAKKASPFGKKAPGDKAPPFGKKKKPLTEAPGDDPALENAEPDPVLDAEPVGVGEDPPEAGGPPPAPGFGIETDPNSEIAALFEELEARTKIKDRAWSQIRSQLKYGDDFSEVVIDLHRKRVDRLIPLPVRAMVVVPDDFGEVLEHYHYRQHDETGATVATFQPWQIVHFTHLSAPSDVYGRSHLYAARRVFRYLTFLMDSLVVNRATRSTMRYEWKIPTGNLPPAQAQMHVDKFRSAYKKRRKFGNDGKLNLTSSVYDEEDDFFVPINEKGQGGVQAIQAQSNLDKIEDVKFMFGQLLAALRVPASYIGYEGMTDRTGADAGMDVAFGRIVRRAQLVHGRGMRQVYDTELVLNGFDPAETKYDVVYAPLGTVDEMREWQVELLKAQVAAVLKTQAMLITDDDYLLRKVLEIDEEDIPDIIAANKEAEAKRAEEAKAQADAMAKGGGGGPFGGGPFKGGEVGGGKPKPFGGGGGGKFGGGAKKPDAMSSGGDQGSLRSRPRKIAMGESRAPRSLSNAVESLLSRASVRRELREMKTFAKPLRVAGKRDPGQFDRLRGALNEEIPR